MRGKRAKDIRKYVRETFPMLPAEPQYKRLPSGTIELEDMCQRKRVRVIKRNYKRVRRGMTPC